MIQLETLRAAHTWAEQRRREGDVVGLVPTMGALHDGHRSLIERAARECDAVVVSIFVNPLQFTHTSDLESYPTTLAADLVLCDTAGADAVVTPQPADVYPSSVSHPLATVTVSGPADGLESTDRPGHFDGVATVVMKLFIMAGPCRAYFGEKDYQQLAVVRTLVSEFHLPVEVIGCEIARADDGVALSSRNVRLSEVGRKRAVWIPRALDEAVDLATSGSTTDEVIDLCTNMFNTAGIEISYVQVVDPVTLEPLSGSSLAQGGRLVVAVVIDLVRLLDNCELR